MAGQIILSLAILVTLHELGHFAAARMFGIKVEKFYLFFDAWGFKLFKFKKGDTEYGIGWLPLGGYVKIAGMIDESLDTKQLQQPAQPWEFRSKPAWQRLIVMLGGVTVNFILGILIFIGTTWNYGEEKLPLNNITHGIYAYELGKEIGLQTGDKITGVNNKPLKYFEELQAPSILLGENNFYNVIRNENAITVNIPNNFINKLSDNKSRFFDIATPFCIDSVLLNENAAKAGLRKGDIIWGINDSILPFYQDYTEKIQHYKKQEVNFHILRDKDTLIIPVKVNATGIIGVFNKPYYFNQLEKIDYGIGQSLGKGTNLALSTLSDQVKGFGKLLSGKIDPRKSLQGPIGIAQYFGGYWNWERFWKLTAILSLILAFMNLLPIPALDGGHVVFLLYEMITGKPINDKVMNVLQIIGMVILLALMVFAFGNDIYKLIIK